MTNANCVRRIVDRYAENMNSFGERIDIEICYMSLDLCYYIPVMLENKNSECGDEERSALEYAIKELDKGIGLMRSESHKERVRERREEIVRCLSR